MNNGYKITPPRTNNGAKTAAGITPNKVSAYTGITIAENTVPTF